MRRHLIFIFLLMCAAFPLAAAVRSDMIVTTDWLAQHLEGQVILIEVGDKADYDGGHIPTARLLERRALMTRVGAVPNEIPAAADFEQTMTALGVGDEKRVVFYSRDPLLATRAWFTLDYFGHGTRASVLNGGFWRWASENRQVTADAPKFSAAQFTARPNAAMLITLPAMKALVRSRSALGPSLVIVDARPTESYLAEVSGAEVRRAGHIPGASSVPWQRNLTSTSNSALFRSDDELQGLYQAFGINRQSTVVTYCRTGLEATMTYFVLRYLGYDVALYDGSFVEWSADETTPVV